MTDLCYHALLTTLCSIQYDPCPRPGEPIVSRKTPEYFL